MFRPRAANPVVKTANSRYRDHGSEFRRVYGPRLRRVFSQREVRPDS